MAVTAELLEQLVAATAEAREATREAHEARADLRAAVKDANDAIGRIGRTVLHATDVVLSEKAAEIIDRIGYHDTTAKLQALAVTWNKAIDEVNTTVARLNERYGL